MSIEAPSNEEIGRKGQSWRTCRGKLEKVSHCYKKQWLFCGKENIIVGRVTYSQRLVVQSSA